MVRIVLNILFKKISLLSKEDFFWQGFMTNSASSLGVNGPITQNFLKLEILIENIRLFLEYEC